MCDQVLILPNEEILASSAKSVPAGEVNQYPRLDLQLRPTRVPQFNEVSYGEEYEEGLEGPTSPRVIEKLRREKEFYDDVIEWEQRVTTDEVTGRTEVDAYEVDLCDEV